MVLTSDIALLLGQFAVKYGIDAAVELAQLFKTGATIDDAIAALNKASEKSAAQYRAEAVAAKAASIPGSGVLPP